MKKNLYLIISMFFTSSLFACDTCSNYDVLSDCVAILWCTTIIHKSGYQTHRKLIRKFNDQNKCDRGCAHCTGCAWNAYVIDRITTQSCHHSMLYIPIVAHNIAKRAQEQFEESVFNAPYNRPKKDRME